MTAEQDPDKLNLLNIIEEWHGNRCVRYILGKDGTRTLLDITESNIPFFRLNKLNFAPRQNLNGISLDLEEYQ